MDERNYKRIESGEKKTMDLDLLGRIADALETEWTELVTGDTVNIEHNEINGAAYIAEGTGQINNFPPDLRKAYEDMLQLMRELMAEKDKMIEMLMKMKGK
jgi:transcriptional regulator with XRE-family HTH domain